MVMEIEFFIIVKVALWLLGKSIEMTFGEDYFMLFTFFLLLIFFFMF